MGVGYAGSPAEENKKLANTKNINLVIQCFKSCTHFNETACKDLSEIWFPGDLAVI